MMSLLDHPVQLQIPSTKIKLQLFPINEQTRLGLEKDGHNPFLELTLSAQKRISSVIRHLNAKWGCSSSVVGQLMLFPYNTKLEQLASCRKWTLNDRAFTAWEVYINVGSPSIFRLRYGWLCNNQPTMFGRLCSSSLLEAHKGSKGKKDTPRNFEIPNDEEEQVRESCEATKKQDSTVEALHTDVNELKASDAPMGFVDDKVTTEDDPVCSTVPWYDDMTMLSIGGLLSEISLQGKINRTNSSSVNTSCVQQIAPTSSTSFRDLLSEDSLFNKPRCLSNKLENESSLQPFILGSSDISIGGLFSEASLLAKVNKSDTQSTEAAYAPIQFPWNDNLTTLSIGGLLSEASLQAKTGGNVELKEIIPSLEPFVPSQSIDSLISAHVRASSQKPKSSMHEPLSILDAEETCHAFSIKRLQSNRDIASSNLRVGSGGCSNDTSSKQSQFPMDAKTISGTVFPNDSSCQGLGMDLLASPAGIINEDSRLWPFRNQ